MENKINIMQNSSLSPTTQITVNILVSFLPDFCLSICLFVCMYLIFVFYIYIYTHIIFVCFYKNGIVGTVAIKLKDACSGK